MSGDQVSIVSAVAGALVDIGVRVVKRLLRTTPPEKLDPRIGELESERVAREAAEARRKRMENKP